MADIKDVVAYLLKHYPSKHELSNARVTKLVYLSDWRHCIKQHKQITNINWYFDNFGPFVWDVKEAVDTNPEIFADIQTSNMYGNPKNLFELTNKEYIPQLDFEEKAALDHIIEVTKPLYWNDFIRLVYSTFPVTSSNRYTNLNLQEKAKEYLQVEN